MARLHRLLLALRRVDVFGFYLNENTPGKLHKLQTVLFGAVSFLYDRAYSEVGLNVVGAEVLEAVGLLLLLAPISWATLGVHVVASPGSRAALEVGGVSVRNFNPVLV